MNLKKNVIVLAIASYATSAHALFGIGDITFDPTTYGAVLKNIEEAQKLYQSAMKQLDGIRQIESTIKEGQRVYKTLASGDLKSGIGYIKFDKSNQKSIDGMRNELGKVGSNAGNVKNYVTSQMDLLKQLEGMGKLKDAAVKNAAQSSGEVNAATSSAITAQSTSALAALATAEEERKLRDEFEKLKSAKAKLDTFADSADVYKAIGK